MIGPLYVAVWLACGLGAAVVAASFPQSRYTRAAAIVGFVVAARTGSLAPAAVGALIAIVAGLILAEHTWPLFSALSSGALGGVLCAQLRLQMVPAAAAWILSASVFLAALILASAHSRFTTEGMIEEALLAIAALGLLIAAVPGIAAGWKSALALNIVDKNGGSGAIPLWVLMSVSGACAAGTAWALFRARAPRRSL